MNPSFAGTKLRQGHKKKISCLYSWLFTSTECRYQRQSLKTCIHKTKSVCVELDIR